MRRPTTRYATTSDGARIAYLQAGEGPAIVFAANFSSSVDAYHVTGSHVRATTDRLVGLGWQVVRHDARGIGASDRDVGDWSLEARVRDLEAAVGRLGSRRFALVGADHGAPTAIAYAVKYPARVSHLILVCPWARGAARFSLPAVRMVAAAAPSSDAEWGIFTNVVGSVITEFADPDRGRHIAEEIHRAMSAANLNAYYQTSQAIDVTDLLPRVATPTLVIHEPAFPFGSFDLCREVAAGIRDAQLLVVRDRSLAGPVHDETIAALHQFLRPGDTTEPEVARPPAEERPLTPREREVLCLIAQGRSNKAIAGELGMSERTAARHITNLYAKIGVGSKAAATSYAIRRGLI